jgi:hypothetical protein
MFALRSLLLAGLLSAVGACYEQSRVEGAGARVPDAQVPEVPDAQLEGRTAEARELQACAKSPVPKSVDRKSCVRNTLESHCEQSAELGRECPRTIEAARGYVCGATRTSGYRLQCNVCGGVNVVRPIGFDSSMFLSFDAAGQLLGVTLSSNGTGDSCSEGTGAFGAYCPPLDPERPSSYISCDGEP